MDPATLSTENMMISDDIYRYELSRWFEKFYGPVISRNIEGARSNWRTLSPSEKGDESFYTSILAQDPLDSLANFNLGVICGSEVERSNEAMWLFWAAALYNPEDAEVWKNAYFSAHNANDIEGMVLSLTLLIYNCGSEGYDLLRQHSLDAGVPPDVQADMDVLANQLMQSHRNNIRIGTRGNIVTGADLFEDGLVHFQISN